MPLGIYISVPFCRSKCSYCNFASGVFGKAIYESYVERICLDVRRARQTAGEAGGRLSSEVDSIYLGGGTPTLLEPAQLERIFTALRATFAVAPASEITVECAPAALSDAMLDTLLGCGVNRISLGVQSFVDAETRAVGRLHTCASALADVERLRAAGIRNFNLDLIAGLPHQTIESWQQSLGQAIAIGAPHVSVYMLEIDEDSRLGRELIAGGTRYHAYFVPDEELTADLYGQAVAALNAAGIEQYEISNFARAGQQSRHNLKYWTRLPYLGFGVDAHSFLPAACGPPATAETAEASTTPSEVDSLRFATPDSLRFATPDSLEAYLASPATPSPVAVSLQQAREESFFVGLRLNRGIELHVIERQYGLGPQARTIIAELCDAGLVEHDLVNDVVRLTARGRLLSNEVFERFLGA
jgi:oxygen-independent coproporphyrinogen-3 oxidase